MDGTPAVETHPEPGSTAQLTRQVKQVTKRRFRAEDKIRIALEGFRKETPLGELCRREPLG